MNLGRVPFLLTWAALFVGQVMAFVHYAKGEMEVSVTVGLVLALQVLKMVPTAWRLKALGMPQDDAVLVMVPFANIGLMVNRMLRPTPSQELWKGRREKWAYQETAIGACARSFVGLNITQVLVLVMGAVIVGVIGAYGADKALDLLPWIQKNSGSDLDGIRQASVIAVGVLVFYTLLQIIKRKKASRASWIPSLFLLPVVLLATLFSAGATLGPAALMLATTAWDISFEFVAGSLLVLLVVSFSEGAHQKEDELFSSSKRSVLDVVAVHGGTQLAIWAGLQVVIPGIYYAIRYAFAAFVTILEPGERAFERSSRLSRSIGRRIFKVYAFGMVPLFPLQIAVIWNIDGLTALKESLFDLTAVSFTTNVVNGMVGTMVWIVIQLALLRLYRDRVLALKIAAAKTANG